MLVTKSKIFSVFVSGKELAQTLLTLLPPSLIFTLVLMWICRELSFSASANGSFEASALSSEIRALMELSRMKPQSVIQSLSPIRF